MDTEITERVERLTRLNEMKPTILRDGELYVAMYGDVCISVDRRRWIVVKDVCRFLGMDIDSIL